jgi:hypothetical protein
MISERIISKVLLWVNFLGLVISFSPSSIMRSWMTRFMGELSNFVWMSENLTAGIVVSFCCFFMSCGWFNFRKGLWASSEIDLVLLS